MFTLLMWAILKSVGIIQTPGWLAIGVPIVSVVIGAISLYHDMMKYFVALSISVSDLKKRIGFIEDELKDMRSKS